MGQIIENLKNSNKIDFRPNTLDNYIGQNHIKEILRISIESAKKRNDTLDHILFFGPPGLGKTTLAYIISKEMNSNLKIVTGNSIEKSGDIASILTTLEDGDVLFIDEIHRIPKVVEESIYSAMEDFKLHITINKNIDNQVISIDLPKFTLIGATTRSGLLSKPLRDRFTHNYRLEFYNIDDLINIVKTNMGKLGKNIDLDGAREIAQRSRGTPRIAINIVKKIRDFADVENISNISRDFVKSKLDILKIDKHGLDHIDLKYLNILKQYGKPVSLKTISSILSEDIRTIEEVIEPYLLEKGYIEKTSRGRQISNLIDF